MSSLCRMVSSSPYRTASSGPGEGPSEAFKLDKAALGAFLVTGALGPLLGWSTPDLVWGLLLTSLVVCLVGLGLGVQSGLRLWLPAGFATWSQHKGATLALVLVGGFMATVALAAAVMAVLMLHTIYLFVAYSFFPFWPETPNPLELESARQFEMIGRVMEEYWIFAALAVVGDWRRQLRPLWRPGHLDVVRPLVRLGRTHLFMGMALVVARWVGTGLGLYVLILFLFFFPWDSLGLWRRSGEGKGS